MLKSRNLLASKQIYWFLLKKRDTSEMTKFFFYKDPYFYHNKS